MKFKFEKEKTLEVLNYFARKNGNSIDRLKALKLLFFADKYMLRYYGTLISKDLYKALSKGPVADRMSLIFTSEEDGASVIINQPSIVSVRAVDFDEFSEAEELVLEKIWNHFGSMDSDEIWNHTHNHPEWKKHQNYFEFQNGTSPKPIDYESFLDDCEEDKELFPDLTQEQKDGILLNLKNAALTDKVFRQV